MMEIFTLAKQCDFFDDGMNTKLAAEDQIRQKGTMIPLLGSTTSQRIVRFDIFDMIETFGAANGIGRKTPGKTMHLKLKMS